MAVFAFSAATLPVAEAGGIRHDRSDERYVALAEESQFAPVVFISPARGGGGSGVLVSDRWVLTAAHVVSPHTTGSLIVDVAGDRFTVADMVAHPSADLALLRLEQPVASAEPAERYRGSDELSRKAVCVGYGMTGRGDETWTAILANAMQTAGKKRAGENVIEEVLSEGILQADFDHPDDSRYSSFGSPEPLDLEFFPLLGDSGGGLFVEEEGRWYLIGITIAGVTGPNVTDDQDWTDAIAYGWISQWHRVSAFNHWIDTYVN